MKHGTKPTVRQSVFLEENGYAPDKWFVVKDTPTELWIVARDGEQSLVKINKIGGKRFELF